jgi:hypothetical protein
LNPRPLAPQASALAKLRYGPKSQIDLKNTAAERRSRYYLVIYLTDSRPGIQVRFQPVFSVEFHGSHGVP